MDQQFNIFRAHFDFVDKNAIPLPILFSESDWSPEVFFAFTMETAQHTYLLKKKLHQTHIETIDTWHPETLSVSANQRAAFVKLTNEGEDWSPKMLMTLQPEIIRLSPSFKTI